jgi:hypothetical protein
MKKCKYCQSEIDSKSKVCLVCKRDLEFSITNVIVGVIIAFAILFVFCCIYNNTPEPIREIICNFGIRQGYPYCYIIG